MTLPGVPGTSIISGLVARLRSLWRGLRRRAGIETEMTDEFRHHVELRTEDLIRGGLEPAEAGRQTRIEFGHIEGFKEDARASRGLRVFDRIRFSWLDVKLGLRMLVKYPGLSAVSVVGMSLAIAIGAAAFAALHTATDPTLPLDEGDRLVSIENWDVRANTASLRSLHDFLQWKSELTSVRELGAFRWETRNVLVANHPPQLVQVAEMTASGFRIARVSPALGRPLLEEDERDDAPPVVVIACVGSQPMGDVGMWSGDVGMLYLHIAANIPISPLGQARQPCAARPVRETEVQIDECEREQRDADPHEPIEQHRPLGELETEDPQQLHRRQRLHAPPIVSRTYGPEIYASGPPIASRS